MALSSCSACSTLFITLHSKFNFYGCTLVVTAGISCNPVPEEILKPKDTPAPETSSSEVLLAIQGIKTEDFAVSEQALICP